MAAHLTQAPPPAPTPKYLSKQELAVYTGLSATTIQRYKDQGRIPFYQPGGKGARVLFPPTAIEATAQAAVQDSSNRNPQPSASTESVPPKRLSGPAPRWRAQTLS